ncbi:non-ribosomal peptide synthetase [Serratia quinivorans]|uniref:non-ribosomal peptide synthetase n=1 Tax=Serratia quinivorans TaxID=137545 RepID=UPI0034C631A3
MKLENLLRRVRHTCAAKPALVDVQNTFTYGELNEMVARCAAQMKSVQYTVVIHVECRIKAIVLMLAAIENHLPFVPVDRDKSSSDLASISARFHTVQLIHDLDLASGKCITEIHHSDTPLSTYWGSMLAESMSVMFTSGTTGTPKGVLVPGDAVVNLLHQPAFFSWQANDVFATYSSLSFDASTFEIFTPLLNGNTLVILNKTDVIDSTELRSAVQCFGISCMWMTAGLFNQLMKTGNFAGLTLLDTLVVGGDKVDFDAALKYVDYPGAGQLFNGYGPTENTVFTTVAPLTRETLNLRGSVPIGCQLPGIECLVWDTENDRPADDGSGLLLVGGKGLSRGYFNDDKSTGMAFRRLGEGEKLYYDTGDHVYRERDGTFYFVGRTDRQVKLSGHRVELGDIESRLEKLGLYERVFCTLVDSELVVMLQPKQSGIQVALLREAMKQTLNDYELPKWILQLTDWPLTANNKLDIKSLQLRAESACSERNTGLGNQDDASGYDIVGIAEQVLHRPIENKKMGLFDIGFDSINIAHFQYEVCNMFNVDIGIIDIYAAGTLENVERLVKEKTSI